MSAKLTNEIIEAAIEGFEAQKHKINVQIAELRALLTGDSAKLADEPESSGQPHRKINAAARKRMAAAQKKRWAAVKAAAIEGQATAAATRTAKPKRKMSAAGRAAIAAAQKKRWAAQKAAAKQ